MNRFEAFRDMQDKWRWRLIAANGRVLVSSNESFGSQIDALRAADAVQRESSTATVSANPGMGPKEVIARLIEREEARRLVVGGYEDERPGELRPVPSAEDEPHDPVHSDSGEGDDRVTPIKRGARRNRGSSPARRLEVVTTSRRPA